MREEDILLAYITMKDKKAADNTFLTMSLIKDGKIRRLESELRSYRRDIRKVKEGIERTLKRKLPKKVENELRRYVEILEVCLIDLEGIENGKERDKIRHS